MGSFKINREIKTHNQTYSDVKRVSVYSHTQFLTRSSGDLLVTGGTVEQRHSLLMSFIRLVRSQTKLPIFILSGSDDLESGLISLAKSNAIGKLFPISSRYPSYDPFSNMPITMITEFFANAALEKGYHDTSELCIFTDAFLRVLESKAPISLNSIIEFAGNSDIEIAEDARQQGNGYAYNMITGSGKGGLQFRQLVNMVAHSFGSIHNSEAKTGFSICAAVHNNCVVYIDTKAPDFKLMSLYFAEELKAVSNEPFIVIFDDTAIINSDELMAQIDVLKQSNNVTVVVSMGNIMALPQEGKTKNFERQVMFPGGDAPPHNLQELLDQLGTYDHFEQTSTVNSTPKLLFSPFKTTGSGITQFSRSKVIIEQEKNSEAILFGQNLTEILIVKHFERG